MKDKRTTQKISIARAIPEGTESPAAARIATGRAVPSEATNSPEAARIATGRAVPSEATSSPESARIATGRAVPSEATSSPEAARIATGRAVPSEATNSPEAARIATGRAVPSEATNSPEAARIATGRAVPSEATNSPEAARIATGRAVPSETTANPEAARIATGRAVPSEATANPEAARIATGRAVPSEATESPEIKSIARHLPEPTNESVSVVKVNGWKGLNRKNTIDSGALSCARDISFENYPYVESAYAAWMPLDEDKYDYDSVINGEDAKGRFALILNDIADNATATEAGQIYHVAARGDKFFIIAENGYFYGELTENEGVRYIAMTETDEDPLEINAYTRSSMRAIFTETVETSASSAAYLMPERKLVVYNADLEKSRLTSCIFTLDVDRIVFVNSFIDMVKDYGTYKATDGNTYTYGDPYEAAEEGAIDTDAIYAVVPTGQCRATEVWAYKQVSKTLYRWCELRRNIVIKNEGETEHDLEGIDNDDAVAEHYNVKYQYGNTTAWESTLKTLKNNYKPVKLSDGIEAIDAALEDCYERYDDIYHVPGDDIAGIEWEYCTQTNTTLSENMQRYWRYKKGLFEIEETASPIFDEVIWYKGRIVGSVGGSVIASEYNTYNGWTVDSTDSTSAYHAWIATSGANYLSSGDFTALRVYLGRVIALKESFMHEITGGSNPFSITDMYSVGAVSSDAVTECCGRLFFAGKKNINMYSGSLPKHVGDEIKIDNYTGAMLCGDEEKCYVYANDDEDESEHLFVYNYVYGVWGERSNPFGETAEESDNAPVFIGRIGMFVTFFSQDGRMAVYRDDAQKDARSGEWYFETEDMTNSALDLKRVRKIKLMYEIEGEVKIIPIFSGAGAENKGACYRYSSGARVKRRGEITLTNAVDYSLRLRFEGSGYFKLFGMEFEISDGGGLNKDERYRREDSAAE